jgi:predicted ATP-binding protein involved in virulence
MADRKTKRYQANGAAGSRRSYPTTGSYFLSLELENMRCFSKKQTLDLSDGNGQPARWTILLGENGTGKTSLLQMFVAFRPDIQSPQSKSPVVSMEPGSSLELPIVVRGYLDARTLIKTDGLHASSVAMVCKDGSGIKKFEINIKYNFPNEIEYFVKVSIESGDGVLTLPVCFGYGAWRTASRSAFDPSDRSDAFESLFVDDAKLRNAENWLLRLDYSASKSSGVQDQQRHHLEMVKDVLIKVLPDVTEIRFDASSGVMPNPRVEFKTPYGWVPLRQLGYGYRTMIAWVVDFASRMVERYPDSTDPLAEPAVVLIDEIDLHLHPKWQRELIGFLTERFPNTQFIATAHSPLIVQAATDANIVLLKREGDHVVIENHPETIRGWRVDQVLTSDLFGLETARPPDMEKLILKRKELLTKSRLTKADKKKLEELDDQLGQIPPGESFEQAKKTMELIEKSLKLIEKYQGTKS